MEFIAVRYLSFLAVYDERAALPSGDRFIDFWLS
jgi:hypothetical protein